MGTNWPYPYGTLFSLNIHYGKKKKHGLSYVTICRNRNIVCRKLLYLDVTFIGEKLKTLYIINHYIWTLYSLGTAPENIVCHMLLSIVIMLT